MLSSPYVDGDMASSPLSPRDYGTPVIRQVLTQYLRNQRELG